MSKKLKLKFINDVSYNGVIFAGGKIYDVIDEPVGFIGRCKARLAQDVDQSVDAECDPRFKNVEIKKEKNEVIVEEIKAEIEVAEVEEVKENNEEQQFKGKKNKKQK